jgi:hypothetical protein
LLSSLPKRTPNVSDERQLEGATFQIAVLHSESATDQLKRLSRRLKPTPKEFFLKNSSCKKESFFSLEFFFYVDGSNLILNSNR